jgi:cytochrome c biogenesis protein CcdA/thiol-disulfide isomerase/thioredoxin
LFNINLNRRRRIDKIIMNYKSIIFVLAFFTVFGCIVSSAYKEVSPSDLISNPKAFEGEKICVNGVFENNNVSGIPFEKSLNFTGEYGNWTLSNVCGTYKAGKLEADSVNPVLSIFTEKEVYVSNETLKVGLEFNSSYEGNGQVQVSGINNAFGRASINQTRDVSIIKGINRFDFVFTTPSCEECSAIAPGVYLINATVNIGGKIFETYKKITLQREGANISNATNLETNITQVMNTPAINNTQAVIVEYFYDPSCVKCAQATPVVERVVNSYGKKVIFSKYNVLTSQGLELAKKYSLPGVPSIVINKEKLISYTDYNANTAKLEALLKAAIEGAPVYQGYASAGKTIVLSVPSVIVVGFLAGFNPCLLAILAFIASVTLATTGKRRNVLLIVFMFSLGIFVTYLVVGVGILSIFEQTPELQTTIRNILVVLIGILGLWHVYDAYHLLKNSESSFYTPKAFIRLTESVTKKVSLPASFLMGVIFSLIKAPCVGAVYIGIIDMVRSGKGAGYMYLAAYNLGVVLPVIVLGAAIAFGLNPEKVEKFRKEKRSLLRLITGVTLLLIAVLMYVGII